MRERLQKKTSGKVKGDKKSFVEKKKTLLGEI